MPVLDVGKNGSNADCSIAEKALNVLLYILCDIMPPEVEVFDCLL